MTDKTALLFSHVMFVGLLIGGRGMLCINWRVQVRRKRFQGLNNAGNDVDDPW